MKKEQINLEAETAVIAGCMTSPEVLHIATEKLRPEDFSWTIAQKAFAAICNLVQAGEAVSPVSVAVEQHDEMIAAQYRHWIREACDVGDSVIGLIGVVKELAMLRALVKLGDDVSRAASVKGADPVLVTSGIETQLMKIAGGLNTKEARLIGMAALDAVTKAEEVRSGKRESVGLLTGLRGFDIKFGGFGNGEVVIVAGAPSQGKTALMLQFAVAQAKRSGVFISSMEMGEEALATRAVSTKAGVEFSKIRTGTFNKEEAVRIHRAKEYMNGLNLLIDDQPNLSFMQLKSKVRRAIMQYGSKVVYIDLLGLMKFDKASTKDEQIGLMMVNLNAMAKEYQVPVVVLCHVNRGTQHNEYFRPRLFNLRESGNIEGFSDMVVFVHRPFEYGVKEIDGVSINREYAELIIAKQRNGATGILDVKFEREYMRFNDIHPFPEQGQMELEEAPF